MSPIEVHQIKFHPKKFWPKKIPQNLKTFRHKRKKRFPQNRKKTSFTKNKKVTPQKKFSPQKQIVTKKENKLILRGEQCHIWRSHMVAAD